LVRSDGDIIAEDAAEFFAMVAARKKSELRGQWLCRGNHEKLTQCASAPPATLGFRFVDF
jgi:hypothetical protein